MLVKACGLRSLTEITWAHDLGYDFWGIVVDPKSKRYVSPVELEQLWMTIPSLWRSRCVLVACKWQSLAVCARFCQQALLQCYEAFPDFIAPNRRFWVIQNEEQWQLCQVQQLAAYYLYDVSLGSGKWHGVPSWCRSKDQLFVAGGLNKDKLQELATQERGHHFFGFDLSSGLEGPDDKSGRSQKDYQQMESCLEVIRSNFLSE